MEKRVRLPQYGGVTGQVYRPQAGRGSQEDPRDQPFQPGAYCSRTGEGIIEGGHAVGRVGVPAWGLQEGGVGGVGAFVCAMACFVVARCV